MLLAMSQHLKSALQQVSLPKFQPDGFHEKQTCFNTGSRFCLHTRSLKPMITTFKPVILSSVPEKAEYFELRVECGL